MTYPKSILVHTKEWYDKTYGNSYFATRIYLDGELSIILPFQYGYENMSKATALKALYDNGKIPISGGEYTLQRDHNITLYYVKEYNQKQREVKLWGKS